MAQLIVRNLDDDVKERLRQRAKLHGQSMEAEVREILRRAVTEIAEPSVALGSRIANRFKKIGFDKRKYSVSPHHVRKIVRDTKGKIVYKLVYGRYCNDTLYG
jgi:plasmid stability protein